MSPARLALVLAAAVTATLPLAARAGPVGAADPARVSPLVLAGSPNDEIRRQAEQAARVRQATEEHRRRVEEDRRRAGQQRQAAEQQRRQAEQAARVRQAGEEHRRRVEEDRRRADDRRRAVEEQRRRSEDAARARHAAEEQRRRVDEGRRRAEERHHRMDEARRRAEDDRRRAEEWRRREAWDRERARALEREAWRHREYGGFGYAAPPVVAPPVAVIQAPPVYIQRPVQSPAPAWVSPDLGVQPGADPDVAPFRCPYPGLVMRLSIGHHFTFVGEDGFVCRYQAPDGRVQETYGLLWRPDEIAADPSLAERIAAFWPLRVGHRMQQAMPDGGVRDIAVVGTDTVNVGGELYASHVIDSTTSGPRGAYRHRFWYAPGVGFFVRHRYEALGGDPGPRPLDWNALSIRPG